MGHGAYKGRVHVIVPFVGRKNGKLFDCQQSCNVLVLSVPGLEEGESIVIDDRNIHLDAGRRARARCTPGKRTLPAPVQGLGLGLGRVPWALSKCAGGYAPI